MIQRVVVFSLDLDLFSVRKGIRRLMEDFPEVQFLLLQHAPPRSLGRIMRAQQRHLKRNGWRWIAFQIQNLPSRLRRPASWPAPDVGHGFELDEIAADPRVKLLYVEDLHAGEVLDRVAEFEPDLGIALAAPILKEPLFSIPRLGSINLHKGMLPHYRGMPPAFWEVYNDEDEVGCTVHRIDAKLDTGPILLQSTVPRPPHATVGSLQLTLDELGVDLVRDAVRMLDEGRAEFQPQPPGGKTYRRPTLKQLGEVERRESDPVTLRSLAKSAFFKSYARTLGRARSWIRGRMGRQRVAVLLYHRISDDMRDNLTVGVEQFDRQMSWIRANYPVVSMDDVVKGRIPRNASRPVVAVTFDDGYRDNYEHASPILLQHRVPAAFFVNTGMLGTDKAFEHDLDQIGKGVPIMTWEQVEELKNEGFTIGSHTVNHIDCGSVDAETLRRELAQSKATLEQRLGLEEVYFAYPFGARHNITPEGVEMVRELGYQCCASAYDGLNDDIDPMNVRRIGVDHRFSIAALQARIEGFRDA